MSGDFRLRKTLRNIHQTLDNEIKPAMQASADLVLASQRARIPRDTGAAADALEAFVNKSGLNAEIGLRGKKDNRRYFYLRFVEHGTKGYSGAARAAKGADAKRKQKNQSDGSHFFGKHPDIPARPAHPWLRPSYDVNRETILLNLSHAVSNTLARAAEEIRNG